jgi:hypothetical protein
MTALRAALASFVFVLPAIGLAYGALLHLGNGLARDAAVPVPAYMVARVTMPKLAYQEAVRALGAADPRDGDAHIARGEAAMMAGMKTPQRISDLSDGLRQAPASARGWVLLAESAAPADSGKAARYLGQALLLAPDDYWLALPLAQDAARLWPQLDAAARNRAVAQARLLWSEPMLRRQFPPLVSTPNGVALIWRAFAYQPGEMSDINRWLALQRRTLSH